MNNVDVDLVRCSLLGDDSVAARKAFERLVRRAALMEESLASLEERTIELLTDAPAGSRLTARRRQDLVQIAEIAAAVKHISEPKS